MKTLLCVDDDADTLKLRQLVFEASGYSVVTAQSGSAALKILSEGPLPDLVVLDYLMPEMNGDELAWKIRQQYPHLPLIAVSAVGQLPQSFLDSLDASVQKGQDPRVLLAKVKEVLAKSASQEASAANANKTILCVEDEPLQLQLRKVLFASHGYGVLTAHSAAAAMDVFRSSHVDAVVMDYWLSGQSGTTVAQEMKRMSPKIPIIILSGFTSLPGEGSFVDSWMRKAEIEPQDLICEVERLIDLRTSAQTSNKAQ